jgi:hypothetical protein
MHPTRLFRHIVSLLCLFLISAAFGATTARAFCGFYVAQGDEVGASRATEQDHHPGRIRQRADAKPRPLPVMAKPPQTTVSSAEPMARFDARRIRPNATNSMAMTTLPRLFPLAVAIVRPSGRDVNSHPIGGSS